MLRRGGRGWRQVGGGGWAQRRSSARARQQTSIPRAPRADALTTPTAARSRPGVGRFKRLAACRAETTRTLCTKATNWSSHLRSRSCALSPIHRQLASATPPQPPGRSAHLGGRPARDQRARACHPPRWLHPAQEWRGHSTPTTPPRQPRRGQGCCGTRPPAVHQRSRGGRSGGRAGRPAASRPRSESARGRRVSSRSGGRTRDGGVDGRAGRGRGGVEPTRPPGSAAPTRPPRRDCGPSRRPGPPPPR